MSAHSEFAQEVWVTERVAGGAKRVSVWALYAAIATTLAVLWWPEQGLRSLAVFCVWLVIISGRYAARPIALRYKRGWWLPTSLELIGWLIGLCFIADPILERSGWPWYYQILGMLASWFAAELIRAFLVKRDIRDSVLRR